MRKGEDPDVVDIPELSVGLIYLQCWQNATLSLISTSTQGFLSHICDLLLQEAPDILPPALLGEEVHPRTGNSKKYIVEVRSYNQSVKTSILNTGI